MTAFDQSIFWPAFRSAGFLVAATATIGSEPVEAQVAFARPDTLRLDGRTRSTDYEIEYQAADLPNLAEGDPVEIDGVQYRVRETPFVPDNPIQGDDGYFLRALLTKV